MQKTIYIRDERHWSELKAEAKRRGKSVSALIQEAVDGLVNESQLDRIEGKIDILLNSGKKIDYSREPELGIGRLKGVVKPHKPSQNLEPVPKKLSDRNFFNPQPKKGK